MGVFFCEKDRDSDTVPVKEVVTQFDCVPEWVDVAELEGHKVKTIVFVSTLLPVESIESEGEADDVTVELTLKNLEGEAVVDEDTT